VELIEEKGISKDVVDKLEPIVLNRGIFGVIF
jgi:hypothetical protein